MDDAGSALAEHARDTARADIPPEDLQAIVKLYQKCPQLWGCFNNIVHVVELMTTTAEADLQLIKGLLRIKGHVHTYKKHEVDIDLFLSVSGFVERGVALARQILRDMGKFYITEFPDEKSAEVGLVCVHLLRSQMLNSTSESSEFCLRLTKTGYLLDLVEDLKHIQHLTVEALKKGEVYLLSLGTIHNCCVYPESAADVRQLGIVPHVTPFLTKRGKSQVVRAIATAVVARLMEEDQSDSDLLTLDSQLLQYFLKHVQGAVAEGSAYHSYWSAREVLVDLRLLARQHFNKQLMVAQGMLHTLRSVLDPVRKRSDEDKKHAVATIGHLIQDQTNLHICQNYLELVVTLKGLARSSAGQTAAEVRGILGKLERSNTEDLNDRIPAFPYVARLLADQSNLLSILHMGLAEFVLDELKTFTGEQGTRSAAVREEGGAACQRVLLALTELAADDVYRREIVSRGGLALLKTVLQTGGGEEKTEAARTVLGLAMAPENRAVIKNDASLTILLEDTQQRADNTDLAQLVDNIIMALHQ